MPPLNWREFWTRVSNLAVLGATFAAGYYAVPFVDWLSR